ncbi:MAG: FAD-dependent oxidoreductase [Eubacteriales bacterium]|nr:FAD-dependent oxidoreductase [Eubacteriales bacterium]
MKQYDAVIIGFGKGGKTLAGALAAKGQKVAVIEQSDRMYGGTCINVGCIPSKSLKTSAERSKNLGGDFSAKAERYTQAVAERERLTTMLRGKNYAKLADHPNIEVLTGHGRFISPTEVEVAFADGRREVVTAPQLFINTGSRPRRPQIAGLEASAYVYESSGLMALAALPERLVIIGGGYIGMEFASMYRHFGSEVTVLQDGDVFLPREDEEIASAVLKHLTDMGIDVLFGAKTNRIADKDGYAVLSVTCADGEKELAADAILLATGRIPNTENLGLETAVVKLTPRGAVQTDEYLRTTNPAIFAMGDVVGGLQFTYISLDDFRIVQSALKGEGNRTTKNRGAIPYSIFLDPPFSRVGLSEREAKEQGFEIKIVRLPAAAVPKAQVTGDTAGMLKAVIDAKTSEILGAHLFCAESHEIINLIKVVMDAHLPYTTLRDMVFTHPTMTESLNDLFNL